MSDRDLYVVMSMSMSMELGLWGGGGDFGLLLTDWICFVVWFI